MKLNVWLGVLFALFIVSGSVYGDDIDVYTSRYQSESLGGQPQVMIIFDNSGSMDTKVAGSGNSRLKIAKDVIDNLVDENPKINFSLSVFNDNSATCFFIYCIDGQSNGGRIVKGLPEEKVQSESERKEVKDLIDALSASGSTPLCETLYEVYNYFAGRKIKFAYQAGSSKPGRDKVIENSNGTYKSPLRSCENVYVIYMTDGMPQNDTEANDDIEKLTNKVCSEYAAEGVRNKQKNCLPTLTEYMRKEDLAPDLPGAQHAYTYTIGFTTDQQLLKDAASPLLDKEGNETSKKGYFTADDVSQLSDAFKNIVANILSQSRTLASSELPATNVTQTRSLDYVYLPRFLPKKDAQWIGNIKKYAFDSASGEKTGNELWSNSADDDVERGGFGTKLIAQGYRSRHVYTDILSGTRIDSLSDYLPSINGAGYQGDPHQYFSASAAGLLTGNGYTPVDVANWVLGIQKNGTPRSWLVGDIIHSTPIAVNYGCPQGADSGCASRDDNVRIYFGTNEGILHAVKAGSGEEAWAFWPQETADMPVYRMLDGNAEYRTYDSQGAETDEPITQSINYGIDGGLGYITEDADSSGYIGDNVDDKALIAFGFRRGGYSYYGLDVTQMNGPPKWAWRITPETSGFATLGQTWSAPMPAKLESSLPVFVFGGGYDIAKDDLDTLNDDTRGTGLYVVDAASGALVGGFAARSSNDKIRAEDELTDSIPGDISLSDLDLNGRSDSAFFADTGGNVWYADISSKDTSQWRLIKLAALGRHGGDGQDRRFFNRPDLVRTTIGGQDFDFLMIGSGDRANPGRTEVEDYLFILNVTPFLTESGHGAALTADNLTSVDLDASETTGVLSFPLGALTSANALRQFAGWRISMGSHGRKVLSDTQTVLGMTFFTAFQPVQSSDANDSSCAPIDGESFFYAFRLPRLIINVKDDGYKYENVPDSGKVAAEKSGDYLIGTPSLHVTDKSVQILGIDKGVLDAISAIVGPLTFPQQGIQPSWWYQEQ